MCFGPGVSATLAAAGAATFGFLWNRKRPTAVLVFFAYFALMELLQLAQYAYVDDCSQPRNRALMVLIWVHIAFQPWVLSGYLMALDLEHGPARPSAPHVARFTSHLSLAASLLMLLKGVVPMLAGPEALPAPLRMCTPGTELLCGADSCGFQGSHHLAWRLPLLEANYYVPHTGLHFFITFVPALIACSWPFKGVVLLALLSGPVLVDAVWTGGREENLYEFASIWCVFSVVQGLQVLALEFLFSRPLTAWAAAKSRSRSRREHQQKHN